MDDLSMEQQKIQFYYRNLSRQQAQQQAWLQKRRADNMARKAAGEKPLPEEDPSNPIFKPIPEPSRLIGIVQQRGETPPLLIIVKFPCGLTGLKYHQTYNNNIPRKIPQVGSGRVRNICGPVSESPNIYNYKFF